MKEQRLLLERTAHLNLTWGLENDFFFVQNSTRCRKKITHLKWIARCVLSVPVLKLWLTLSGRKSSYFETEIV